jgi:hypothetical protein
LPPSGSTGEDIAAGDVWVATGADGQIAGVVGGRPAIGSTTIHAPSGFSDFTCAAAPAGSPMSLLS